MTPSKIDASSTSNHLKNTQKHVYFLSENITKTRLVSAQFFYENVAGTNPAPYIILRKALNLCPPLFCQAFSQTLLVFW